MAHDERTGLDYRALFAAVPVACVVLDADLVIVAANDTYLRVTGRDERELIGRSFFEAYPQGSGEGAAQSVELQRISFETVLATGRPDTLVLHRFAIPRSQPCGDWYDVVDLGEGRLAMSVGDVVGHGVGAASVMGILRAAYSASVRIADGPSGALEALGLYARAYETALATTTFACQLFPQSGVLSYSSAGHPPPLLLRADGRHEFLDRATDPPLGVRPEHVPRPQATVEVHDGDTLIMYTDGLVERRHESIDVGLDRLVEIARPRAHLPAGQLADEILGLIANPAGAQDDVSLLIARF